MIQNYMLLGAGRPNIIVWNGVTTYPIPETATLSLYDPVIYATAEAAWIAANPVAPIQDPIAILQAQITQLQAKVGIVPILTVSG
jgi:hypothetical protein